METPDTLRQDADPVITARTIALIGLMGAGKTSVGKRLAVALNLPFVDSDEEIEKAAGMSVPEIFKAYGEPEFRELERRVIARLMTGGPHVLATGGGAFLDAATRALIKERATSIWLKADVAVLARRVARKDNRPLLEGKNPRKVLTALAADRHPVYAAADITIESGDLPHTATVDAIVSALRAHAKRLST